MFTIIIRLVYMSLLSISFMPYIGFLFTFVAMSKTVGISLFYRRDEEPGEEALITAEQPDWADSEALRNLVSGASLRASAFRIPGPSCH